MSHRGKKGKSRSKELELNSSDSDTDKFDIIQVGNILKKLTIQEQAFITQKYKKVPQGLIALWKKDYTRLELGKMQWQLRGENLHCFLKLMRVHFQSAHFRCEQLQEELNILEKAGIGELPQVSSCVINRGNSVEWEKNPNFQQWPFHALPRLLTNLSELQIFSPIYACFIDQFKKLETLKIHDGISKSAMKAIMESDIPLQTLHFYSKRLHILKGISMRTHLENLMVNLNTFQKCREEIVQLPNLLDVQIYDTSDPEETLQALIFLIDRSTIIMKRFRLNCGFMFHSECLKQLNLKRCCALHELHLVNCQFDYEDIAKLNLPVSQSYAAFFNCPDLTDVQLLDFYKSCPNLKQFILGSCPQLTGELLHNVLKVRSDDDYKPAFLFMVTDCPILWNSYQENEKYWERKTSVLKVEVLRSDVVPAHYIHFYFHKYNPESWTPA